MIKVLFVCWGNICRSPMAEFIFKNMVKKAGLDSKFHIESRATHTDEIWNGQGNPVYSPAREKLAEHGISCEDHAARQLTNRDYDEYDLLIGMDQANLTNLSHFFGGDPDGKLSLLLSHVDPSDEERHGRDVADPWYTRKFNIAYDDITAGCTALFEKLTIES